jgi:hypothetical protein
MNCAATFRLPTARPDYGSQQLFWHAHAGDKSCIKEELVNWKRPGCCGWLTDGGAISQMM